MNYTFLTMWKTLDGTFHSNTADYTSYDAGVGNYHNKFLPLQNDTNVSSFCLVLLEENGNPVERCRWERATEETTES